MKSLSSYKGSIDIINESILKTLDLIGVNYTIISVEGDYIAQNHLIKNVTKNIKKAQAIDERSWENCKKLMESGQREIIEEEFEGKTYLSVKNPIFEGKKCIGIVVLSIDITEKKQAEIIDLKYKFINSINHDIKTPFVGLSLLSSSMAESETDEKKKKGLMLIYHCSQRMMKYLNTILDTLSSKNPKKNKKEYFNIKKSIENVADMLKPLILQKNLNLIINAVNESIRINKMYFEQICLNLIANAVKFTEKGTITISAALKNNCLTFSVEDTGIGIEDKNKTIIFEKFERVIPSYHEPEFRGCGLGLSLAKDLVKKMGGSINVESIFHKGSTFRVSIPQRPSKGQKRL